jgi:hypothetical protein
MMKPRLVKQNAQVVSAPVVDKFVSRRVRVSLPGISSDEPLAPLGIRPGFVAIHEKGKGRVNSSAGTHTRGFARRVR